MHGPGRTNPPDSLASGRRSHQPEDRMIATIWSSCSTVGASVNTQTKRIAGQDGFPASGSVRRIGGRRLGNDVQLRRSEVRLVGLRQGGEALIEVVFVVLGADHFLKRTVVDAAVTLDRVPRHRKSTEVFDVNFHF
jgi:hypothetical protein